jgi:hypothetical protein
VGNGVSVDAAVGVLGGGDGSGLVSGAVQAARTSTAHKDTTYTLRVSDFNIFNSLG